MFACLCMRTKMVDLGAASVVPYVHQDQVQLLQACKARYKFILMTRCSHLDDKCTAICTVIAARGACTPENTSCCSALKLANPKACAVISVSNTMLTFD